MVFVGGGVTVGVMETEALSVEVTVGVGGGVTVREVEKDPETVKVIDSGEDLEKEMVSVAVEVCVGGGVMVSEAVLEKLSLWLHDVVSERPFDSVLVDDRVMVIVGVGSLRETDVVAVVELLCRKGPRG